MGILVALFILGLVVMVHEYGHYRVLRKHNIPVMTFAIGIGPTLWKKQLKGGAMFKLNLILLGGFVRPTEKGAEMILKASTSTKIQYFIGGMLLNAVAAFIILTPMYYYSGEWHPMVNPFISWAPPFLLPLLAAFALSFGIWFATPIILVMMIGQWLVRFLVDPSTAGVPLEQSAGPIGIVAMMNDLLLNSPTAWDAFLNLTHFFAMINGAIAGMNAIPLIPLDGGHITQIGVEKISGRFRDKIVPIYQSLGFVLIGSLVIFVVGKDIWTYFIQ